MQYICACYLPILYSIKLSHMHHASQISVRPSGSNGQSHWTIGAWNGWKIHWLCHDSGASSHYRKAPWRRVHCLGPPPDFLQSFVHVSLFVGCSANLVRLKASMFGPFSSDVSICPPCTELLVPRSWQGGDQWNHRAPPGREGYWLTMNWQTSMQ